MDEQTLRRKAREAASAGGTGQAWGTGTGSVIGAGLASIPGILALIGSEGAAAPVVVPEMLKAASAGSSLGGSLGGLIGRGIGEGVGSMTSDEIEPDLREMSEDEARAKARIEAIHQLQARR
jgi:hypothetical protein